MKEQKSMRHEGDEMLDLILDGTGFSSRTKALRVLFYSGMKNKNIKRLHNLAASVIPKEDALAVALQLRNQEMNCGGKDGNYLYFATAGWYSDRHEKWVGDVKKTERERMCEYYACMRDETLRRWREAVARIVDLQM